MPMGKTCHPMNWFWYKDETEAEASRYKILQTANQVKCD